jgi:hypothetical protein
VLFDHSHARADLAADLGERDALIDPEGHAAGAQVTRTRPGRGTADSWWRRAGPVGAAALWLTEPHAHRPYVWWNGEIIGSWAIAPNGEPRTRVIADRGAEAPAAIDRAASHLHARLNGTAVTPAIRTPLDQALTRDDSESTA